MRQRRREIQLPEPDRSSPKRRAPSRKGRQPRKTASISLPSSGHSIIDEDDHHRGHHEDECRRDRILRAHADAANAVTAGASAAETGAKSDERTGNGRDNERAHRPKEGCALPQRKTQRGSANQAEKKYRPPVLSGVAATRRRANTPEIPGFFRSRGLRADWRNRSGFPR